MEQRTAASPPPGGEGIGGEAGVAAPSRRSAVLRTGLVVGVLVVVFGIILPRFVELR